MKKYFAILPVVLLSLMFAACQSSGPKEVSEGPTDEQRADALSRLQHQQIQRAFRQLALDLVVLRGVSRRLVAVVVRVRVAAAFILRPLGDPGTGVAPGMNPRALGHRSALREPPHTRLAI